MKFVDTIQSPQIEKIHSGKVRESFRIDDRTRMIVVSDRISSFDSVLNNLIPFKGAVLNGITNYWFEKTRDIVENHFIRAIDPNISLVKETEPVRIEMIVRGYLTGSMWRGYEKGKRTFSGVQVPDGLEKNRKFPKPIVTPTTKEEHDREITPEDIIREKWTTEEIYGKMDKIARVLFDMASSELEEKGLILVDTKYEFGILDDEVILIDEIHTPDSSRFWDVKAYEKDPGSVDSIDKEYVRQWLLENKKDGILPDTLPEEVIEETSRRYLNIYKKITGNEFIDPGIDVKTRMHENLVRAGIIKDGFVVLIMGSPSDKSHCQKIVEILKTYDIFTELRVVSAHKNGERIPDLVDDYNNALEPGAVIAVAGRSNGLGGALSANMSIPVINCPPFKDKTDLMVNINSSLMMPSKTPALTVIDPGCAAQAALRALNLPRLKRTFLAEIKKVKQELIDADSKINS